MPKRRTSDKYVRSKTLSSYSPGSNEGGDRESEKSERRRVRRVKALQKRAITVLGVLAILVLFIGTLIFNFTSNVTINAVSASSDIVNAPEKEKYEKLIDSYLGSRPSSRLRLSLDLADLSNFLQNDAPEVKYVKRASFNGLGITNYDIVFREPIIRWQVGDKTYYVDSEGVTFQNNLFASPQIELRDASLAGGLINDGEVKISRRILEFSGRLVSSVHDQNYQVEYLSLPADTTRQIALKTTNRPTEFIFSIDQSVAQQVDAMKQAITYMDETGQGAAIIDLRVPNRAYYK